MLIVLLSDFLGIRVKVRILFLIEFVGRLSFNFLMEVCLLCGSQEKLSLHHLFSQSKWAVKLYGNLIHDQKNIVTICLDCHLNKPVPKWSEIEFCNALGIVPRSKIATRTNLG
jgi:hypothetical protein